MTYAEDGRNGQRVWDGMHYAGKIPTPRYFGLRVGSFKTVTFGKLIRDGVPFTTARLRASLGAPAARTILTETGIVDIARIKRAEDLKAKRKYWPRLTPLIEGTDYLVISIPEETKAYAYRSAIATSLYQYAETRRDTWSVQNLGDKIAITRTRAHSQHENI